MHRAVISACMALIAGQVSAQSACTDELVADLGSTLDALLQAGCELTSDQISRAMDNPVGEMVSVPLVYERKTVTEPFFGTEQVIENVKLIPTFPIRLNERWTLVNRVVLSFPKVPVDADALSNVSLDADGLNLGITGTPPNPADFAGSTTGFGDLTYVGLFTPNETTPIGNGKLIWAIGPTFIFPTASEDFLGQGKYQAGIAGALAYLGEDWTLGLFPQHWWSFAGDDNRPDVNRTNVQYFVYRKLPDQWSIGASPTVSINWNAQGGTEVDVPIGIGVNKTAFIGKLPVRFSVEYHDYVTHSSGINPEASIKFSISPAVPAAFLRNR